MTSIPARAPKRIQMSRRKPWRADSPDAVIVARPSKWGNPFSVYAHCKGKDGDWGVWDDENEQPMTNGWTKPGALEFAVSCYRSLVEQSGHIGRVELEALRGKDLACWCPLDGPCHADVLLELANR